MQDSYDIDKVSKQMIIDLGLDISGAKENSREMITDFIISLIDRDFTSSIKILTDMKKNYEYRFVDNAEKLEEKLYFLDCIICGLDEVTTRIISVAVYIVFFEEDIDYDLALQSLSELI